MKGLVFVREVEPGCSSSEARPLFTRDKNGMTYDPIWLCACVSASVATVASAVTSLLSDVLPGVK